MALVKSDIGPLLRVGLKTVFFQTFEAAPVYYPELVTRIESDKDTEEYAWLGALPGVREFLDERQAQDMAAYSYAVKNKTWESTISVDRTALEDDQYGQLPLRIKQMATVSRQHLDVLAFGLLAGGFTQLCYDGTPFFGSHPNLLTPGTGGTLSNKGTDPLSASSLQAAITAMMRYKDDQGKVAGVMPNLLVVPPELSWEAKILLESGQDPDPVAAANQDLAINPLKGLLRLAVVPYLPDPSNWFILDTKRVIKAIVLQMRKDFEFTALDDEENAFMRDEYFYGVRARYNCGFGDWRAAYGAQVS